MLLFVGSTSAVPFVGQSALENLKSPSIQLLLGCGCWQRAKRVESAWCIVVVHLSSNVDLTSSRSDSWLPTGCMGVYPMSFAARGQMTGGFGLSNLAGVLLLSERPTVLAGCVANSLTLS